MTASRARLTAPMPRTRADRRRGSLYSADQAHQSRPHAQSVVTHGCHAHTHTHAAAECVLCRQRGVPTNTVDTHLDCLRVAAGCASSFALRLARCAAGDASRRACVMPGSLSAASIWGDVRRVVVREVGGACRSVSAPWRQRSAATPQRASTHPTRARRQPLHTTHARDAPTCCAECWLAAAPRSRSRP